MNRTTTAGEDNTNSNAKFTIYYEESKMDFAIA
jgi:hypothetical protein